MVAIKDIEMPMSCFGCPFATICTTEEGLNFRKRPSDCPLVEIITCKDCNNCYPDEDGRGYHCERDSNVRFSVYGDFYCKDAIRRV